MSPSCTISKILFHVHLSYDNIQSLRPFSRLTRVRQQFFKGPQESSGGCWIGNFDRWDVLPDAQPTVSSTERKAAGLDNRKCILTICSGDGFFGSGQPETSSCSAEWFVNCSLFLLTACNDNLVLVTSSFLDLKTLSAVFFFGFLFLFSTSSPVVLWTMVFRGLSAVTVLDFTDTLQP